MSRGGDGAVTEMAAVVSLPKEAGDLARTISFYLINLLSVSESKILAR